MAKTIVFRSLKDEIRRYWLARPPGQRTFSDADAFAHKLWELQMQAGSSFDIHRNHVLTVVQPLAIIEPR